VSDPPDGRLRRARQAAVRRLEGSDPSMWVATPMMCLRWMSAKG